MTELYITLIAISFACVCVGIVKWKQESERLEVQLEERTTGGDPRSAPAVPTISEAASVLSRHGQAKVKGRQQITTLALVEEVGFPQRTDRSLRAVIGEAGR